MEPGTETSTFAGPGGLPGLDTTGSDLTEEQALHEDILRAVSERPGVLFWAPDQTLDLSDYIEKGMTQADRIALQARIERLFEDDPRYDTVRASVQHVQGELAVRIYARAISGVQVELQFEQDGTTMRAVEVTA